MDSSSSSDKAKFENFDVVPEPSADHYFIGQVSYGNPQHYSHIMKEWKILKKNLPEAIYVQVCETRIDLLRAVIIGPQGTPYHDGLFFFDIFLPWEYPAMPPILHYHSRGYDLNPNLYVNGTVCLSLINTWQGSKVERWRRESTILQVLVSIQGLVLNDRPYFNEPKFEPYKHDTSPTMIEISEKYNTVVFLHSCQMLLHIMQRPPANFVEFVAEHFRQRNEHILADVKTYQGYLKKGYGFLCELGTETYKDFVTVESQLKKVLGKSDVKQQEEIALPFEGIQPGVFTINKKDVGHSKKKGIWSVRKLFGCFCKSGKEEWDE